MALAALAARTHTTALLASRCHRRRSTTTTTAAATAATTPLPAGGPPAPDAATLRPMSAMPGPGGLPFFGPLREFLPNAVNEQQGYKKLWLTWEDWRRRYGDVVRFTTFGREHVLVFDPQLWAAVLRADGKYPVRQGLDFWKKFRQDKGLPGGLVMTDDAEWRRVRRLLDKKMFAVPTVEAYAPRLNPISAELVSKRIESILGVGAGADAASAKAASRTATGLRELLFKWALESISTVVFGVRLGAMADAPHPDTTAYINAVQDLFVSSNELLWAPPLWKYYRTGSYRRMAASWEKMDALGASFLERHAAKLEADGTTGADAEPSLLEYMLSQRELTRAEAMVNTGDMLAGGVDTTANVLIWTLLGLATNPAAQQRVHDEVRAVLGGGGGGGDAVRSPTIDELRRMPLIKAAVKESLRLYPVTWSLNRTTQQDLDLGGYFVPKNTDVGYSWWALTRDAALFPEPDRFVPERFLPRGSPAAVVDGRPVVNPELHPFSLTPFGFGPRSCIGQRIALLEAHLALVHILQRYRLEWHQPTLPDLTMQLLVVPDRDVKITFIDRLNEKH